MIGWGSYVTDAILHQKCSTGKTETKICGNPSLENILRVVITCKIAELTGQILCL